jgi:hypothetical protein
MKSVLLAVLIALGMAVPAHANAPMTNAYGGAQPLVAPPAAPPSTDKQPPLLTPSTQDVKGDAISGTTSQAAKKGVAAVAPVGTAATASSRSNLPFTGFDVLLLLAGGSLLVAVGFGMRRLSRVPDPA